MIQSCGSGELLVIGFVLMVVFLASRMSAVGNALGQFVYSFRKAARGEGFVDGKVTRRTGPDTRASERSWVEGRSERGSGPKST